MSSHTNNIVTDITTLIPQRPPIMMVSKYHYADNDNCDSWLHITSNNIFLDGEGHIIAEGLLEHIAQTAAAHIGYKHIIANEKVGMGFIGDIKRCTIAGGTLPAAGAYLHTHLKVVSQVGNITMITAETEADGIVIVTCRMKLTN